MEQEIAFGAAMVSALLKSIEAEDLFQYLQENRYQFRKQDNDWRRYFKGYHHLDH